MGGLIHPDLSPHLGTVPLNEVAPLWGYGIASFFFLKTHAAFFLFKRVPSC